MITTAGLFVFGECMAELGINQELNAKVRFSGDVYNLAVYAKRWKPELDVHFNSAVGEDFLSRKMLEHANDNNVDTTLTLVEPKSNLGIYSISTDDRGESSYDYWRAQSAASQYFNLLRKADIDNLISAYTPGSIAYFTGISIGLLKNSDKDKLLWFVAKFKKHGFTVAFDSNYRPKLWTNSDIARCYIEKCYQLADIILPGLEDHNQLFGHNNLAEMKAYFSQFKGKEIVMKCAAEGMLGLSTANEEFPLAFNPAPVQIDSTAAGDSFAGTYLACRMTGSTILNAMKQADEVARFNVGFEGGIVPKKVFDKFRLNTLPNYPK